MYTCRSKIVLTPVCRLPKPMILPPWVVLVFTQDSWVKTAGAGIDPLGVSVPVVVPPKKGCGIRGIGD